MSLGETGHVVVNRDDKNSMDAVAGLERHIVTYGSDRFRGRISRRRGESTIPCPSFDIIPKALYPPSPSTFRRERPQPPPLRRLLGIAHRCDLRPGGFNGACAGLSSAIANGADVYDDYAYHPEN